MRNDLLSLPVPDCFVPDGFRLVPITFRKQFGKCHYCKVLTYKTFKLSKSGFEYIRINGGPDEFSIDHKLPKSKGGGNEPSNKVRCCASCNTEKGSRDYEEFKAAKRGVSSPIGAARA